MPSPNPSRKREGSLVALPLPPAGGGRGEGMFAETPKAKGARSFRNERL